MVTLESKQTGALVCTGEGETEALLNLPQHFTWGAARNKSQTSVIFPQCTDVGLSWGRLD